MRIGVCYTFPMIFRGSETKVWVLLLFCSLVFCLGTSAAMSKTSGESQTLPADLAAKIPLRPERAPTGSMFAASVSGMDGFGREQLSGHQGKTAIYGWHLPSGKPIQPLSTLHGAKYADYSHGIRLVSEVGLIDGQPRSLYDILEDPKLARLLSDEGAMPEVRRFMGREHEQPVQHARLSHGN